jgi:hypothetical protein
MKRFTPEEDQFIEDHYLSLPANEIDRLLCRPHGVVRERMKLIGLTVPPELLNKFKEAGMYRKGKAPFNKGKKLKEWMSKKGIKAIKKNQFKKNQLPWNTNKPGDIVVWEKNGCKVLMLYLNPTNRIPLQRYIWQQSNGPIPKGFNVIHKDRNVFNCNIDNLELISNADLMLRNSALRYGPEIFKIIQLRGALNRQINKRLNQLSNEK